MKRAFEIEFLSPLKNSWPSSQFLTKLTLFYNNVILWETYLQFKPFCRRVTKIPAKIEIPPKIFQIVSPSPRIK